MAAIHETLKQQQDMIALMKEQQEAHHKLLADHHQAKLGMFSGILRSPFLVFAVLGLLVLQILLIIVLVVMPVGGERKYLRSTTGTPDHSTASESTRSLDRPNKEARARTAAIMARSDGNLSEIDIHDRQFETPNTLASIVTPLERSRVSPTTIGSPVLDHKIKKIL